MCVKIRVNLEGPCSSSVLGNELLKSGISYGRIDIHGRGALHIRNLAVFDNERTNIRECNV
jgi:hypothetical protein